MSREGQHSAMLHCNVTLVCNVTPWLRHLPRAIGAARISVIKRDKRGTDFLITVLSHAGHSETCHRYSKDSN